MTLCTFRMCLMCVCFFFVCFCFFSHIISGGWRQIKDTNGLVRGKQWSIYFAFLLFSWTLSLEKPASFGIVLAWKYVQMRVISLSFFPWLSSSFNSLTFVSLFLFLSHLVVSDTKKSYSLFFNTTNISIRAFSGFSSRILFDVGKSRKYSSASIHRDFISVSIGLGSRTYRPNIHHLTRVFGFPHFARSHSKNRSSSRFTYKSQDWCVSSLCTDVPWTEYLFFIHLKMFMNKIHRYLEWNFIYLYSFRVQKLSVQL